MKKIKLIICHDVYHKVWKQINFETNSEVRQKVIDLIIKRVWGQVILDVDKALYVVKRGINDEGTDLLQSQRAS